MLGRVALGGSNRTLEASRVEMSQRLPSSMERRLQTFRREMVVDLFTSYGLFWDRVEWVRKLQRFNAESRVPPVLNPQSVHFPPWLKPEDGRWSQEQQQHIRDWMALLHVLHDDIVPKELQVETQYSYS